MGVNIAIMGYPINHGPGSPSAVTSVFGRTGNVVAMSGDYSAASVGADPAGTSAAAIAAHLAASNPHVQYQRIDDLEAIVTNLITEYDNNVNNPLTLPFNLRNEVVTDTAAIAQNTMEIGYVTLAKSFQLRKLTTNRPARVRLYMTVGDMTADLSRPFSTTPPANSGVILDIQTNGSTLYQRFDYPIEGYDDKITPDGQIAFAVTNLDTVTDVVEFTLAYLRTE